MNECSGESKEAIVALSHEHNVSRSVSKTDV